MWEQDNNINPSRLAEDKEIDERSKEFIKLHLSTSFLTWKKFYGQISEQQYWDHTRCYERTNEVLSLHSTHIYRMKMEMGEQE